MKFKKLFGLTLTGVSALSVAACGSSTNEYTDADLRLVSTVITEDLSSISTSLSTDFLFLNQIGEGLTRKGSDDAVLAETTDNVNYTFSDGLAKAAVYDAETFTWTFTLRNAKWANGDTVTADDFVFAWQRVVDPESAAAYASLVDVIKNGAAIRGAGEGETSNELYGEYEELGVTAVNDTTLKVELTENVPYFLSLMSFGTFNPVHQETYNASLPSSGNHAEARYGKDLEYIMEVGPFKVKEWDVDYGIILEKNETYWDAGSVEIDSISWKLVGDSDAMLSYYEQGKCDRVGITGAQYEAYKDSDEVEVKTSSVTWYLNMNLNNTYTANPDIREAIATVINKGAAASSLAPYQAVDWFVPDGIGSYQGSDFRTYADQYNDTPVYSSSSAIQTAQGLLEDGLETLGVDSIQLDFLQFDAEGWQDIFKSIHGDLNDYLTGLSVDNVQKPAADVYDTYDYNNAPTVQGLNAAAIEAAEEGETPDLKQVTVGTDTEWELGWYGWGPDYNDPTTFLDLYKGTNSHNVIGLYDLGLYDSSMVSSQEYSSWAVTRDGKTAAQASEYYDSLLAQANAALQSNDFETYYDYLAQAEAYLIDNHFIIPIAQKAGGILDNGRLEGIVAHADGADYTWKWVSYAE